MKRIIALTFLSLAVSLAATALAYWVSTHRHMEVEAE
jgi:hypothetical protein